MPHEPCPARFDPDLLHQVLANLCDNAAALAEAEAKAGVSVRLGLSGTREGWALEVADDGPGVPAHARDRLFQPYASFRPGGTGLALDHGGDLEHVPSATGATFRLTLPASTADPA